MPLSVICRLANQTQCNIHFCIPHLASDACVQSIADYFRNNLDPGIVITFEYSNECWNYGFQQTAYCRAQGKLVPNLDPGSWYGYRAAQCMKLIRDLFNSRSRWRGCLATQTVNSDVTKFALAGVDHFRANDVSPANSLAVTDLFDEISVTGYFGNVQASLRLDDISNSNPAVVTRPSHGYKNGQRLKFFIATGMTELNNTVATVGNAARDTFELAGVDSTSYRRFIKTTKKYAHPALVFEIMDKSAAQNLSDPIHFPTKYTFFNQVCVASWLTGATEGVVTTNSVRSLKEKSWPAQKTIADAHGLDLRQYEGGLHYVGDILWPDMEATRNLPNTSSTLLTRRKLRRSIPPCMRRFFRSAVITQLSLLRPARPPNLEPGPGCVSFPGMKTIQSGLLHSTPMRNSHAPRLRSRNRDKVSVSFMVTAKIGTSRSCLDRPLPSVEQFFPVRRTRGNLAKPADQSAPLNGGYPAAVCRLRPSPSHFGRAQEGHSNDPLLLPEFPRLLLATSGQPSDMASRTE